MSTWRRAIRHVQPYLNVKIDADSNGTIDTTLSYVHTPIPLKAWTTVDTINSSATGATGWFCQSSTVVTCSVAGMTWAQVLDLLPDGAVFQNSLGFPEVADLLRRSERIGRGRDGPRGGGPVDLGPR